MKNIILASTSARRKALLEQLRLEFKVDARVIADEAFTGGDPAAFVKELSVKKAQSVAKYYTDAVIIGADTIGVVEGQVIGKPHTPKAAREMLALLSGKKHAVITGFTVMDTGNGETVTQSVETAVYFKTLTKQQIDAYVATGEPLDKAGGYGIQGLGAVLVERIEGDYNNVIGLPLGALTETLKQFGVKIL